MHDEPTSTDTGPSHMLEKEDVVKKILEAHQYIDGKTDYTDVFNFKYQI